MRRTISEPSRTPPPPSVTMRRTPLLLAPLLAAGLLLAGCMDAPQGSTGDPGGGDGGAPTNATHHLGGAFTREVTQAQLDEAQALARAEGADMLLLESFPLQFSVPGLSAEACARLRGALDAKDYVAEVRACQPTQQGGDPDAPTSSGPSQPANATQGAWRFHGTFTQDFTDEDVRAVCEAAGRGDDCVMMKSLPPQYDFSYPTREACEAARERVLGVPHVAGVTECRAQG